MVTLTLLTLTIDRMIKPLTKKLLRPVGSERLFFVFGRKRGFWFPQNSDKNYQTISIDSKVANCDQPPLTSPTALKTLTKTSWFSPVCWWVAPIFFSDFRWLCVWWSMRFLSAFMAHKGSGASVGIECLFYWDGGKVPMQGFQFYSHSDLFICQIQIH